MNDHNVKKEIPLFEKELTGQIIAAAIEVHRVLGPGLLESVYQVCLAHEFSLRQLPFEQEKALAIQYKDLEESYKELRAPVSQWFSLNLHKPERKFYASSNSLCI